MNSIMKMNLFHQKSFGLFQRVAFVFQLFLAQSDFSINELSGSFFTQIVTHNFQIMLQT